MFASTLKQRLAAGQPTLGILLTFDFWPGHIEIFKAEGIHYAVADFEHGTCDLRTLEDLCRTARLLDFPLLVRPEAAVHHMLKKYLDAGAAGLMMPWTETRAQIETVRDAMFSPPRGRRGPGGPSIFANRSLDRAGWDEVEQSLFAMIQIESREGMAAVRDLATADWIDAVMLGPYDLSLNLSRWGQMDHPEVVESIRQIRRDSEAAGKPCGMVTGSPDGARFWFEDGFRFLLIPDPSYLARAQMRAFRQVMSL
ncbi:MAG: aldolase/citrate lyase family protein [Bryobacteraceae bacterium]